MKFVHNLNCCCIFKGPLGLGGFVLDDDEFISGDFNSDRDDIKELEADNYEDQLSQPEVFLSAVG